MNLQNHGKQYLVIYRVVQYYKHRLNDTVLHLQNKDYLKTV